MTLDARQLALLHALARRDARLREEHRSVEFMLMRAHAGRFALKPGVEGIADLDLQESDMLDLEYEGFVRTLGSGTANVRLKFSLTALGRTAGHPLAVTAELQDPPPADAPPSADDVLAWIYGLSVTGPGSAILETGGALINEALSRFGPAHTERVARWILDLRDEGFVAFDDPAAHIDQFADSERLTHARDFRLTSAGRDRPQMDRSSLPPSITQIIHATHAQVAAGDINTYVTFNELLDQVADTLDDLEDIDEDTREDARGILRRLRAASGTVATGATTSAGAALLVEIAKQLTGLA
jgi:hypothetical protein